MTLVYLRIWFTWIHHYVRTHPQWTDLEIAVAAAIETHYAWNAAGRP